ncbi:MAG: hypothetical protein JSS86_09530 [Cyanobacteria bacterium SZAS LIN-2]|nr:hypothetical protein [Cyanobacteria bacterium SZAS LIN-2]
MALEDAVKHLTQGTPTQMDVLSSTAAQILPASKAFAEELYQHPLQTVEHAGTTLLASAAMGAAIGYVLPARGPAALIVAGAFTIPMAVKAYNRLDQAFSSAQQGQDLERVSKALAFDTVAGTYDLSLNLAGGVAGTEIGVSMATSRGALGSLGQASQRMVMKGENWALNSLHEPAPAVAAEGLKLPQGKITTAASRRTDVNGMVNTSLDTQLTGDATNMALSPTPEATIGSTPLVEKSGLAARLEQHRIINPKLDRYFDAGQDGSQMYFGSLHGHSRYSDGLGLPKDLYNKAIAEGQQVTTITDHNHLAARGGVAPDDPRTSDQAGTPVVAANPIEYSQTFADAAATTTSGKHVSLVGTEMGTIGKVGGGHGEHGHGGAGHPDGEQGLVGADLEHMHDHHSHGMMNPESIGEVNPGNQPFNLAEARAESNAAAHIGGVNHINLIEVPQFFEATRQPKTGALAFFMRALGKEPEPVVTAPEVIKYNDGDYKAMVDHLDKLTATDGGKPVIQLNHPRYLADENANTPIEQRSRDYGQKSFKNQQEWLDRFATPYVRQIELIKGGALNPNPVDTVPTGALDPTSFAGYLDKGVHASPTFGRDFHFGDPVGNPGATGFYAKSLDKSGILNALRERRTIATTSSEKLSGVLTGNDKFVMGAILDHSVVPSLSLKMRVDGIVHPEASYTLKLWGDTKLGDGKLAEVVQQKTVKGSDLLTANQTVAFDAVTGTVGQNSAYYVEVLRKDPSSGNTDRMWTAPIWLETLAGTKHSLFSRFMAGQASSYLPNPFQSKLGSPIVQ